MKWLYGILCLIFLIIFHEFGHFIAAKLFGVKVEKVNTAVVSGKLKRQGKYEGYTPDYKKAIVQLKKDSKSIELFDSLS